MDAAFSIPLCLFPSAHWLALASPKASVNAGEIYLKQTYRNRYDILGVNGRLSLTAPVEGQKGEKTAFKDIRLTAGNWRKQHVSTLRSAYGRAAYFEHYFDTLEDCLLKPQTFLLDLNLRALAWIQSCGVSMQLELIDEPWSYKPGDYTYRWEPSHAWKELPAYPQVFSDRHPFMSGLSAVDLIMNLGPRTNDYLAKVVNTDVV
jgi:hypothetical protein